MQAPSRWPGPAFMMPACMPPNDAGPHGPSHRPRSSEPDSLAGTTIAVAVDRKGHHLQVGEDESHALTIGEAGIRIQALTDLGASMRSPRRQRVPTAQRDEQGRYFPHVSTNDAPLRFPWRALLDVCRHFMPREVVLRELDGLELVKMNVLHLHLTGGTRASVSRATCSRTA